MAPCVVCHHLSLCLLIVVSVGLPCTHTSEFYRGTAAQSHLMYICLVPFRFVAATQSLVMYVHLHASRTLPQGGPELHLAPLHIEHKRVLLRARDKVGHLHQCPWRHRPGVLPRCTLYALSVYTSCACFRCQRQSSNDVLHS
ncbi:hypothetical protein B0H11DRAFT_1031260 [Mycena galericulata]|nr:hypothetical protein B0H11DRAFT_1031260 [Mycena galericulata]